MLGAGVAAGEWHPGLSWKPVEWLQKQSFKQCCGSEMIYSGSSYEFLEFRVPIRILPMLFKHIWKSFFKNLNFNQKVPVLVESTGTVSTICNFLFPATVLQYSTVLTQSRIQRRNKIFICCFIFFCFRIQNNNSGSGSRNSSGSDRIRIHNIWFKRAVCVQHLCLTCWAGHDGNAAPSSGQHVGQNYPGAVAEVGPTVYNIYSLSSRFVTKIE